jgi:hypothetical protein
MSNNLAWQWAKSLCPGDRIDAADKYGDWLESVVERVSPATITATTASMVVHYKGWSKKFDETIEEKDYTTRLAPLHTRTENWRAALQTGSEIEYTMMVDTDGSRWLPGIVVEVNDAFNLVSVKFKKWDGEIRQQTDIALDNEKVIVPW